MVTGLTEEQTIDDGDMELICKVVMGIFPEATKLDMQEAFRLRPKRAGLYV